MKRIYLFFLLLLLTCSAFSQQFSFGIRGGLGTYSMNTLDHFQHLRTQQTQLPLKITESYPATLFYRVEMALNELKFIDKIALFYGYYSTGARSTVSDYSGRIDLDAVINGNQLGLSLQKAIFDNIQWSYGFYAEGSYLFSHLKTKDYLEIVFPEKITDQQEYSFNSGGFSCEPGIMLCYYLNPLIFQINLGYQLDFSGKLYVEGSKDRWLEFNQEQGTPEWTGLRLGLQVSYVFKKSKE